MPETRFCYCCRCHHPREQMRPFATRNGLRWRCLRSIQAATRPSDERDDFGRKQSAINRADQQRLSDRHFVPLGERQLAR